MEVTIPRLRPKINRTARPVRVSLELLPLIDDVLTSGVYDDDDSLALDTVKADIRNSVSLNSDFRKDKAKVVCQESAPEEAKVESTSRQKEVIIPMPSNPLDSMQPLGQNRYPLGDLKIKTRVLTPSLQKKSADELI